MFLGSSLLSHDDRMLQTQGYAFVQSAQEAQRLLRGGPAISRLALRPVSGELPGDVGAVPAGEGTCSAGCNDLGFIFALTAKRQVK